MCSPCGGCIAAGQDAERSSSAVTAWSLLAGRGG
jgi:hypothetical protein